MKFHISPKDLKWLVWLNEHGFATAPQLARHFSVGEKYVYKRTAKLVKAGFLRHTRILHGKAGVYHLTSEGARLSGTDLVPVRHIRASSLDHDLIVIDVGSHLVERLGGSLISERRLRSEAGITGVGTSIHIADGHIKTTDRLIALEIENTTKSEHRLQAILRHYMKQMALDEVWYVCTRNEVANKVKRLSHDLPFIHVYTLESIFSKEADCAIA